MRAMRRPLIVLLEIVGLVVAGLALAAVLLAWRLSAGPVQIDFATGFLERTISRDAPFDADIGGTSLRWQGFDRPVVLGITELRFTRKDGTQIASLAAATADVSVPKLLRGIIAPLRLDLVGPRLRLVRTQTGEFTINLGQALEGEAAEAVDAVAGTDPIADLLAALDAPPGSTVSPLASLARVTLVEGSVTIEDRLLGQRWSAPSASIDLRRTEDGIEGSATLDVLLGNRTARISTEIRYPRATRRAEAAISFADIVPAELTRLSPVLAPLDAIASPVSGHVNLQLDEAFRPVAAGFALDSEATRLKLPPLWPTPLSVARIELSGTVAFDEPKLSIETFAIDLGGPTITIYGDVALLDGAVDMLATATIADFPADLLNSFWPPGVTRGGRSWITANLRQGTVTEAQASIHARAPASDPTMLALMSLDGGLAFEGMAVNYLDGLPEATAVAGTATFDETQFRVDVAEGRIGDVAILPSSAVITGLDAADQVIDIDLAVSGPVRTALTALDAPRLGYASDLGIDPARASGEMAGRLRFVFSLLKELPFEAVRLAAAVNLRDIAIRGLEDGYDLSGGNGRLSLDGRGMTADGRAAVNGVPVDLRWSEAFAGSSPSRITVAAQLDAAAREALHLPAYEGLDGTVGVEATARLGRGGATTVEAELDLTAARLAFAPLDWSKPVGEAAIASGTAEIGDEGLRRLSQVAVEAPGLAASGSVQFVAGEPTRIDLDSFTQSGDRLSGSVELLGGDRYALDLRGPRFDASRFLAGDDAAPPVRPGGGPELEITLAIDEVVLGEGRSLRGLHGRIVGRPDDWRTVQLAATLPTGGRIDLAVVPDPDGGQNVSVDADDAGGVLLALDIADNVEGGRLAVRGRRAGPDAPLVGTVDAADVVMREAPGPERLVAATSPDGLRDRLSTSGLTFDRLTAGFTYDPAAERIELSDGSASGGDLGLTFEGSIDMAQDAVDMNGTIVPVYGLNQAIGAIPLLGPILTGGENGGLIAFTYAIEGAVEDPQVSVNPLSALAPGILRRLFFEGEVQPRDEDAREPGSNR